MPRPRGAIRSDSRPRECTQPASPCAACVAPQRTGTRGNTVKDTRETKEIQIQEVRTGLFYIIIVTRTKDIQIHKLHKRRRKDPWVRLAPLRSELFHAGCQPGKFCKNRLVVVPCRVLLSCRSHLPRSRLPRSRLPRSRPPDVRPSVSEIHRSSSVASEGTGSFSIVVVFV